VTLAEKVFAAQAEDGGFLHGGFDYTTSWHITEDLADVSELTESVTEGVGEPEAGAWISQ